MNFLSKMDKIDNKLIIHVVSELVIVGGIAFYLNNKIKSQSERISQLESQNLYLKQMCESHDALLKSLTGKKNVRPQPQKKPSKPIAQNVQTEELDEEEELEEELKNNLTSEDYSEL